MPIVEYLDPSANYKFHQFKLGSQFVPENWIKVPEGAECCFEYQWEDTAATIEFFKDNRNLIYSASRSIVPIKETSIKADQLQKHALIFGASSGTWCDTRFHHKGSEAHMEDPCWKSKHFKNR